MTYKKKVFSLSALVIVLAAVYILSIVFDPGRPDSKSFSFLDPEFLSLVDGIDIYGPSGNTALRRENNKWFFAADTVLYPVKQGRAEDFLSVLSGTYSYSSRTVSAEGRERLSLADNNASRVVVRGGAGLPLLELFIGAGDALGREVYLRRSGENNIYSGEDRFTFYIDSSPSSWYDLRAFSQNVTSAASVQQAEINFFIPDENSNDPAGRKESYILRRNGNGWIITENEGIVLDSSKVEAWLRSALETEGEDFGGTLPAPESNSVWGSVMFHLGDGSSLAMRAGQADAERRRVVTVSGSQLAYILSERTINRLFIERSFFTKS